MFKKIQECDLVVLVIVISLTCIGVVMVYSASNIMAAKKFGDSFFFLKRQGIFALVGFLSVLGLMCVDYHFWKKLAAPLLLLCIVLLVLVLIPGIGGKAGGSSRWIKFFGFNIQPSELAKIALIIYMSYSLEKKKEKVKSFINGIFPYMFVLVILISLMMLQPDLGGAMTIAAVACIMLLTAAVRKSHVLSIVMFAIPFVVYKLNHGYHKNRMEAWFNPWADPEGKGFQIIQSWLALGTGGVFGRGLGEGKQKLFYLPEAHTDFILSVVGEELGFVGVTVIVVLFFLLAQRGFRIAVAAPDIFGRFLAFGIAVLLTLEAFVNMCVVTGIFPTKGLALPFISYGGSSLLVNLIAVGILLNISSGLKIEAIKVPSKKGDSSSQSENRKAYST